MPRLPGGQGSQLFGIGLFVPGQIPLEIAPQQPQQQAYLIRPPRANYSWVQSTSAGLLVSVPQAVPARANWPEALQPPRINYSWAFQGPPPPMEDVPYGESVQTLIARPEWPRGLRTWIGVAVPAAPAVAETVPARAGPWPEAIQPPRRDYNYTLTSNVPLLTTVTEAVPAGIAVQQLVARPDFPRGLRTWLATQIFEEGMPVGEVALALVARPEYPRSLRTWIQETFYEEQAPVGEAIQQFRRAPDYPRSLRTWLSTQIFEEGMPVGESVLQLVVRPEWPRGRTWTQSVPFEEQIPVGESVQRIAIGPEFLRSLRTWLQWAQPQEVVAEAPPVGVAVQGLVRWPVLGPRFWSQGIANVLTEEPQPAGRATLPLVARPEWPRGLRTWTWAQTLEEPIPPFQVSWARPPVAPRRDYWFVQSTNIALLGVVIEAPPVGAAVQALVRWAEYPKTLRSWTQTQLFEEPLPIGQSTFRRVPDPEYPRTLRSWTAAQLFEEPIPPRPTTGWPRLARPRDTYNWVQATNIALLSAAVEVGPPQTWAQGLVRPYPRGNYNWVQSTNIALLSAVEQVPVGGSIQQRLRDPEYLRSLRSRAASKLFEERLPVGQATFRRVPDPEFLRSLRAWSRTKQLEERMPVGTQVFRRVPDPEFLRSLRGRTHSQLPLENLAFDQTILPGFFADPDTFFPPQILQAAPEPLYDYPIEHSLKSDYGIRKSKLRRGRYVIGRR